MKEYQKKLRVPGIGTLIAMAGFFFGYTHIEQLLYCSDYEDCMLKGREHRESASYEDAIRSFDRAIEYRKNDSKAFGFRGLSYLDLKEYRSALSDFDYAIRINPNYGEHYYHRGLTFYQMNDIDNATRDFKNTLSKEVNQDTRKKATKKLHKIKLSES